MKQLKITTKITSRDSFSIDKYLSEISKLPMLSEEEETIVAKQIRDGDTEAMEGDNAGDVLPGQAPIASALLELKKMAGVAPKAPAKLATPAKPKPKAQ